MAPFRLLSSFISCPAFDEWERPLGRGNFLVSLTVVSLAPSPSSKGSGQSVSVEVSMTSLLRLKKDGLTGEASLQVRKIISKCGIIKLLPRWRKIGGHPLCYAIAGYIYPYFESCKRPKAGTNWNISVLPLMIGQFLRNCRGIDIIK